MTLDNLHWHKYVPQFQMDAEQIQWSCKINYFTTTVIGSVRFNLSHIGHSGVLFKTLTFTFLIVIVKINYFE